MTEKQKYLKACNFAIMQLTKKGSCSVVMNIGTEDQFVVDWKDVGKWLNKEYEQEPTTKNDLGVEKIIDEIEKEFEKVDIPIMDKLTLFAKVQNALYKCAVSNSEIPNNSTTKNDLGVEHHKQNIQSYAHDFGVSEEQAEKELRVTTKNDLGIDCIDRQATLDAIIKRLGIRNESYLLPAERTIYQQIKDMPLVTPQEPFINKPCVSSGVCEHDKQIVLDKIRAEVTALKSHHINDSYDDGFQGCRIEVLDILDKYKAESEGKNEN